MAKWGSCDFKQLKKLQKKMEKFEQVDEEALMIEAIKKIAQYLYARAQDNTPYRLIGKQDLKGSWRVSEPTKIGNSDYEIEVYNSMKYAKYVEFGHRQRPGRFIPGYWVGKEFVYDKNSDEGMVLKARWVEGAHMLTKAEMELERKKDRMIEKMLEQELRKLFNDQ